MAKVTKYHVTDDGRVMSCAASVQACQYSQRDDNRHFDVTELAEAEAKASEILLKNFDQFNTQKKTKTSRRVLKNNTRKAKKDFKNSYNKVDTGSLESIIEKNDVDLSELSPRIKKVDATGRQTYGNGHSLNMEALSLNANRFPKIVSPINNEHFNDFNEALKHNADVKNSHKTDTIPDWYYDKV